MRVLDALLPEGSNSTADTPRLLTGERVAFTGTLASMTHRQAARFVEDAGGVFTQHVSHQTTLLVVGEEGWPLEVDGRVSVKLEQARQLQRRGQSLRIVSESEWRRALGIEAEMAGTCRYHTPAMLSQMLGISVHTIRRWERLGLIHAVRRVLRLPYFDFRDVSGARRLAQLLSAGVPLQEVRASLEKLQQWIPGVERPLDQLEVLSNNQTLLYRDPQGLVEPHSGQRVFDFEVASPTKDGAANLETETESDAQSLRLSPFASARLASAGAFDAQNRTARSAEDWFEQGCLLADEHEPAAAVEAFRLALVSDPGQSAYHFHLADALYRVGNPYGAVERYYAAVELDHDFIEAWTQIGCVLAELGETQQAMDALRVALDRHADYPDAHFHLAGLLQRSGASGAARPHWLAYLSHDQRGPWAELARRSLGLSSLDPESAEDFGAHRLDSKEQADYAETSSEPTDIKTGSSSAKQC